VRAGIPRFGVTHPVPVNLLAAGTVVGGVVALLSITREFFPDITPRAARITLPYPGATPQEIEEGMALKVEDAIAELDVIDRITTTLAEGGGGIVAEFRSSVRDVSRAVDEVERAVASLQDLPEEAEEIQVAEFVPRMPVIMITLHGNADEEAMKRSIRRIRDDLASLPGMGELLESGVREYEIRVDVPAAALLEHGVSLPAVADAIRAWMADVPGGSVRTGQGDVRVRTTGVEERAEEISGIVIRATSEGGALRLGDIATVREDYVDEQLLRRFDGRPAVSLTVFKTGDQDAVQIAEMVRAYAAGRRGEPLQPTVAERARALVRGDGGAARTPRRQAYELGRSCPEPLPGGLSTHSDLARFIEGRLNLLARNARWGALLVFATLLLFLNWRAALWVELGLVTALGGTLMMMKVTGVTLNLLTMFGLIIVLGMLVDDAIVVAENIQARHDRKEPALVAAIRGTEEVFWPVVATVITTIVAFIPLRFIEGRIGDLLGALPVVVACALALSLIEALLILPAHMGHSLIRRDRSEPRGAGRRLRAAETARDRFIFERVVPGYARLLALLLRHRYVAVAAGAAVLLVSLGTVAGDRVRFTFLSASDTETTIIDLRMPIGTAIERTDEVARRIESAAVAQPEVKSVGTIVGTQMDLESGDPTGRGGHLAQLYVELEAVEKRQETGQRNSGDVIAAIRRELGALPDVERIGYAEIQGGPGGADVSLLVTGEDEEALGAVVDRIEALIAAHEGVYDVADDRSRGQREARVELLPGAAALGLTVADVAAQVRGALFGLEPHVYSASREDIKVRVRLDEPSRRSLYAIEHMYLVTPDGRRVPLEEVARVHESTSYSLIRRVDRRRAVTISAETAPATRPEPIVAKLQPEFRRILAEHPGVRLEAAGRQRMMRDAFRTLPLGFAAACLLIYINLAWLFGRFAQPFVVMLAIPFSLVGVIWGHLLLGYEMTFLSLIGFVALSGIVVNDSLILVDFYNVRRREGAEIREALVEAGRQRLRPILLTTITTVLSLMPLILERSFQAKFLIPMAISVSFGLMSATALVLVLLPCIMAIFDDVRGVAHWLWHGSARSPQRLPPPQAGVPPGAR
jgi:multidrug efflux pump subunit AcrB